MGPNSSGSSWMMLRSIQNSDRVSQHRLSRGTTRRILRFARPYRRDITVFLITVMIAAGIGVATPLLAGQVVNAITAGGSGAATLIAKLALAIGGLAVADAFLSLAQRWYSARIGEGIILDLRTRVYDHVQRMPLQFFTRTQTGALGRRLTNDVLGAQRAFTSTLSGVVSNVIQLVLTAAVMFSLSWQITVLSLLLLPIFVIPARRVGKKLAEITRESYNLDAKMNATMTERFNVSGALLVKLFGRPEAEAARFGERADRVRDIGIQQAMFSRTFFVAMLLVASLAQALTYGLGGWLAVTGSVTAGTVVTLALLLTRLYGPLTALSNVRVDVMSALVSFDRVFEVLDLKPGIEARSDAVGTPAGAGRGRHPRRARPGRVPRRALPLPERERGLARHARGRGRARPHRERAGPARCGLHRRTGPDGRAGRPVRRRQVDDLDARVAGLRRHRGRGAGRRRGR